MSAVVAGQVRMLYACCDHCPPVGPRGQVVLGHTDACPVCQRTDAIVIFVTDGMPSSVDLIRTNHEEVQP